MMTNNRRTQELYEELFTKYPTDKNSLFHNLVNFSNHREVPIQRWFKYREGYSIELVKRIVQDLDISGFVLDPFVGSGTTTLASASLGLRSIGFEINPFSCFVARVKSRKYTTKKIQEFENLFEFLFRKNIPADKPELSIIDKAFNPANLESLLVIKQNILEIEDEILRDLAMFVWLSILEETSNTYKEGNGIKYRGKYGYRRPPRKESANYTKYQELINNKGILDGWEEKNVKGIFSRRFFEVVEDLYTMDYSKWIDPIIDLGDARNLQEDLAKLNLNYPLINLSLFSPPYANCFDYFEIFKIELWMGGFVKSYTDLKQQRNLGLVSNLNVKTDNGNYSNPVLEKLISEMDTSTLWDPKIPSMLNGYFKDMEKVILGLRDITRIDGYSVIVVANSAYGNVVVPTDILLAQIAENNSFKVNKIVEVRKTNTSAQQMKILQRNTGGFNLLRESLVILQRV